MSKILIAEDDKFLANAYRVKLGKSNFEIKIASDGEETMALLNSFSPDLLLLDLLMPKKDGFVVLEEIRASDKWKNLPIVVASNLGQKEDIDRAMKLGATDYVVKADMSLDDLIAKINKLIGSQKETPPQKPAK